MDEKTPGERLASIETALGFIREDLEEIKGLTKRVSTLERWRAYLLGAAAVLGGLGALALDWLRK